MQGQSKDKQAKLRSSTARQRKALTSKGKAGRGKAKQRHSIVGESKAKAKAQQRKSWTSKGEAKQSNVMYRKNKGAVEYQPQKSKKGDKQK